MSKSDTPSVRFRIDAEAFGTTHKQVRTLVDVIGSLESICRSKRESEDEDDEDWKKLLPSGLEGGSRVAVEVAIIRAADRLSSILEDTPRWKPSLKGHGRALQQLIDAQLETQQEATVNEALKRRPALLLKPFIRQFPNGSWAVYLTGPDGKATIAGAGPTPAEAADDFDRTYLHGSPPITHETKPQDRPDPKPTSEEPGPDERTSS